MKNKLQRLKSCRPSPGHLEINQWIRQQEVRLGINHQTGEYSNAFTGGALGDSSTLRNVSGDDATLRHVPTVTVYPGPVVIERLTHYAADH